MIQEVLPRVPERDQQSPVGPRLHHQLSLDSRSERFFSRFNFASISKVRIICKTLYVPTQSVGLGGGFEKLKKGICNFFITKLWY